MDIHRCRFVPFPATAINTCAFSHPSDLKRQLPPSTLRLALGRANGDIEIWHPRRGNWVQEKIMRSGVDRSIESLVWTHDLDQVEDDGRKTTGQLRLFSIGYTDAITEWDLAKGRPLRHSSGNAGQAWCLAAQPRWKPTGQTGTQHAIDVEAEQKLVTGCADGSLVLHSTADGDLTFLRTLPRPSKLKCRVLSVAFLDRSRVVAGYSDSAIRIYSIVGPGKLLGQMSLGGGAISEKGSNTLVWSVKCLDSSTIISGDSTGELKIWDAQTLTLRQRIRGHRADVLDVAASVDGSRIFSTGIDRRTTVYDRSRKHHDRWIESAHQRVHAHDVKALAAYETKDFSVVISGGVDATPRVTPLRLFGREETRSLPSLPALPPLAASQSERLLVSWWERSVSIWQLSANTHAEQPTSGSQSRQLVTQINIQGEETISSASINSQGSLLAVATPAQLKIFRLRKVNRKAGFKVRKLDIDMRSMGGASLLQFSPDGMALAVVQLDNSIVLINALPWAIAHETPPTASTVVLRPKHFDPAKRKLADGHLDGYEQTIVRIAWSIDSSHLVAGALDGTLHAWFLPFTPKATDLSKKAALPRRDSDTSSQQSDSDFTDAVAISSTKLRTWKRVQHELPRLPSSPLVMSFRPSSSSSSSTKASDSPWEDRLVVITCDHDILEYHVSTARLSEWSRRNTRATLPPEFLAVRDRAMGCLWDATRDSPRFWLYGISWLWMLDLSRNFPIESEDAQASQKDSATAKRKRKRDASTTAAVRASLMRGTTGAGNRIAAGGVLNFSGSDASSASETQDQLLIAEQSAHMKDADMMDIDQVDDADELRGSTLFERGEAGSLLTLRRNQALQDSDNGTSRQLTKGGQPTRETPHFWRTYKYRPILGIVPIGPLSTAASHNEAPSTDQTPSGLVEASTKISRTSFPATAKVECSAPGIEVALVERPLFEAELPDRWEGTQEWSGL